tara:strand:- start:2951 stop:3211 length:261 start_codon:yes stop_codon:yes gene_type:complete
MESENMLQTLINLKQIVEVSQSRGCWKAEEMKDIGITYNNVSEIVKQLQAKQTQEKDKQFEEITEEPVLEEPEPEPELDESVEKIN